MSTAVLTAPKDKSPNIRGIVDRSPTDLKPWPGNPRKHSDQQMTKLKASIRQFGFTSIVLVDECGVILSGHGRVEAAIARAITGTPWSGPRFFGIKG
jgi:ParB-like chromosome segregation protein Spo0J